jgi:putative toxin-antitoxin system antitoxin component (TIGR02293 family)
VAELKASFDCASETMASPSERVVAKALIESFADTAKLLGGKRLLRREIRSQLDVHDLISATGIVSAVLRYVMERTEVLRQEELASAIGVSVRTLQRLTDKPAERLTKEQSGRTWKFAEVLAKATRVFGDRREAEIWLKSPAIALEQRRPIDLLSTTAGTELVDQLLTRLEYGVYT